MTRVAVNIGAGKKSVSIDKAMQGNWPKRLLFMMLRNTDFTGSADTNPYNFIHFGFNHCLCSERTTCTHRKSASEQSQFKDLHDSLSHALHRPRDTSQKHGDPDHARPVRERVLHVNLRSHNRRFFPYVPLPSHQLNGYIRYTAISTDVNTEPGNHWGAVHLTLDPRTATTSIHTGFSRTTRPYHTSYSGNAICGATTLAHRRVSTQKCEGSTPITSCSACMGD